MRAIQFLIVGLALATCAALPAEKSLSDANELYFDGKFSESAQVCREILDSDPGNAAARYRLVLSLLAADQRSDATAALESAPESVRASALYHLAQAHVSMAQDELAKAAEALAAAESADPTEPQLAFARGKLQVYEKKYSSAARELDKAVELEKRNAYAHYYAGIAYSNLKRPDKMVNHFQYFLKLAPDAPEARKVQSLLRTVR